MSGQIIARPDVLRHLGVTASEFNGTAAMVVALSETIRSLPLAVFVRAFQDPRVGDLYDANLPLSQDMVAQLKELGEAFLEVQQKIQAISRRRRDGK